MSCLWLLVSLTFVLFQQSASNKGASNKEEVLKCNQTEDVNPGGTVTLNCTISYSFPNCVAYDYRWMNARNAQEANLCDNGSPKYRCEWDNKTYVSLTISNVSLEEGTYKAAIMTTCAMEILHVKVQVQPNPTQPSFPTYPPRKTDQPPPSIHLYSTLPISIVTALVIFSVACFLIMKMNRSAQIGSDSSYSIMNTPEEQGGLSA